MKIPWLNSAPTPAGRPYDWLEKASNDTGDSLWNRLFRGGIVAGLYRLFTVGVILGFVIIFIVRCIRAIMNAGDPAAKADFKRFLFIWAMCLITFLLVRKIVSIFLGLGGALL
ncbi:MAG: hypothetical protein IJL03_06905 [Lachnospiraceae bacterium]|nr:hypothetical protein [Lachnospiraceae bacterium]